jgi:signal transduction histidine kinase
MDVSLLNIHMGTTLLSVFSAIIGRVINDLRKIEKKLIGQNKELEQTNKELDRFVYSVSHDLSAPLKSILGLVNISKLSNDSSDQKAYMTKIETSVGKLELFIDEILDYSRNKRKEIVIEHIQLKELCQGILENLKYIDGYNKIQFDLSGIESTNIENDRVRLKIVLNNIITNAIRFQKNTPGHSPQIKISTFKEPGRTQIVVEDNGEGIRSEVKPKIFDMFYRGNQSSQGSGLGLYIAKETAQKINGSISVESEYGKGTQFKIELSNLG